MSNGPKIEEKKKFELPHIFILLFFIIVVCAILTWIIPAGLFDRVENESGRMIAVAGTWHRVDPTPVGPFKVFTCLYDGMVNAAEITLLVFLTFASTIFVTKSGAFDGLVSWMLKLFKGNSSLIIIPVFMVLFGIGSSTIGMFEEWLPFIPIFAAIFIGMGYDAITGLAVVALGAGMGYSGATMNPFTVGVAQGIAEVPYPSGVAFRILVHAVMLVIAAFFVMRYAKKVKADPTKSLVYGDDFSALLSSNEDGAEKEFGIKQKLVLIDLLVAIIVIVYGTKQLGWYFAEICATFVIMGIIAAIIMRFNLKEIGKIYEDGFRSACTAALMIGIARGILMVLNAGQITDTIVYGMSLPLSHFAPAVCAVAMLILQTLLNFAIPSGSGQAAVSMPIMAPLADMLGVQRDVAVLAYQMGDGLSNIVWPTAYGAVMAGLAEVKVEKWWKFIFPVFGVIIVAQAILLVIAVSIGFGA